MTPEPLHISARDGVILAASLYEPAPTQQQKLATTVIINSGVAIRRRFYDRFAHYLCQRGFTVITYDYRGIGDSLAEPISQCNATIADWGTKDFPAVIEAMSERFPDNKIKLIGHSFGGQILGMTPNNHKIAAMYSVATQSGFWKHWPAPMSYAMAILWHGLMPGMTALVSYFPAKLLNMGENLPAGVARQWASWCREPDYLLTDARANGHDYFGTFQGQIYSVSFDDDRAAPEAAVNAMHAMYVRAQLEREHVQVGATHQKKIGHFGFFKMPAKNILWHQAANWLAD